MTETTPRPRKQGITESDGACRLLVGNSNHGLSIGTLRRLSRLMLEKRRRTSGHIGGDNASTLSCSALRFLRCFAFGRSRPSPMSNLSPALKRAAKSTSSSERFLLGMGPTLTGGAPGVKRGALNRDVSLR